MCRTHLIDDFIGLILYLTGFLQVPCFHQFIHLQEQFRHNAIGTADTAFRTDHTAADKLLIRSVEDNVILSTGLLEQLDILHRHGRILDADHSRILPHLRKQALCQRNPCQLRDIVDDKIGIRRCIADIVPVFRDRISRQREINRRDTGDRIHPKPLRMGRQLFAVLRVIAGYMRDHRQLAGRCFHYIFQYDLTVFHALIDTFPGRTVDIDALHAFSDKVFRQRPHSLRADIAFPVIAGIKCGNDSLIFIETFHI